MPASIYHTMNRKNDPQTLPNVNAELSGFNIEINEFGEIVTSFDVNKLNQFLDKSVEDKKFRGIDVVKRLEDEPAQV